MINDILSLIEVATIAINETTILEIKVTIRPVPIKFDNVFKSSDEGKGICQKCDARSEFLFLLITAIAFYFLLSVVILGEA